MRHFLLLLLVLPAAALAQTAAECVSCTATVNTTPSCDPVDVKSIPFSTSCGDVSEAQNSVHLYDSSACTYADSDHLPTTVTCKRNVPVTCDPCCGSCPPDMPRVSGHSP